MLMLTLSEAENLRIIPDELGKITTVHYALLCILKSSFGCATVIRNTFFVRTKIYLDSRKDRE